MDTKTLRCIKNTLKKLRGVVRFDGEWETGLLQFTVVDPSLPHIRTSFTVKPHYRKSCSLLKRAIIQFYRQSLNKYAYQRHQAVAKAKRKSILLFHGTTTKNLRKILKQGLVTNPKQRVFSDDTVKNDYTIKTVSDAVYLTTNCGVALASASRAVDRLGGGKRVIIAVKMSLPRHDLIIDEDHIIGVFGRSLSSAMRISSFCDFAYLIDIIKVKGGASAKPTINTQYRKFLAKAYGLFLKNLLMLKGFKGKDAKELLVSIGKTKKVFETFKQAVLLYTKWCLTKQYNNFSYDYERERFNELIPTWFPPKESEGRVFRAFAKTLVTLSRFLQKLLTRAALNSEAARVTVNVALPSNIGFKGKTRIVSIIAEVQDDYKRGYRYKVVYNKDPIATESIKKCIKQHVARDAVFE